MEVLAEQQILQAAARKLAKEAFVSNLNGGSISEINAVTLVAPASILLWSALQARQSFFTPYIPLACLADFLLNGAAILSATTIYSSNPLALNLLLLIPALTLLLTPTRKPSKAPLKPPTKDATSTSPDPLPVKPFVTSYRGTMMVITCTSILAVDFRLFPRRFAKVENWGTSLMDLGVGSFVFSSGTVAARTLLKQRTARIPRSLSARLRDATRHALPLLILGLIRFYSVKGLDYAEHVAEYGVHWNFFFTLGFMPPFVALLESFTSIIPSHAILALLVATAYQVVLDSTDLKAYILTAPRVDLLSQNREGVFSFFGYLAIFLAGQATGTYILPRTPFSKKQSLLSSITSNPVLRRLTVWSTIWISLFLLSTSYSFGAGVSVSRRLANLPYVLWVAAFNTTQILLFALVEAVCFPDVHADPTTERRRAEHASSRLLRAVNRNGLVVFLLANVLTGAVNMSIDTLNTGTAAAAGILVGYLAVLCSVALTLDYFDVSIKL